MGVLNLHSQNGWAGDRKQKWNIGNCNIFIYFENSTQVQLPMHVFVTISEHSKMQNDPL